ncbi:MAG: putative rane protein, partial [Firmicutes bacterium]|nr:putative rane protein [Bacillota bacterium]
VFGFVIYDNLKKKEPKPPKEKAAKANKSKVKKAKANKAKANKAKKSKADKSKADKLIADETKVDRSKADEPITDESKAERTVSDRTDDSVIRSENRSDAVMKSSITEKVNTITKNEIYGNTNDKVSRPEMEPDIDKGKETFFVKMWNRIRSMISKIKMFFESLKDKVQHIFINIISFKNKWDLIVNFLRDEMNKEGIHLTFASLKKLLKHVLPSKVESKLVFGTGDPCSTGQALGAMSILYSFYGDKIRITPDFERNRLEGQHYIRGRIRLVTILIIVVKLIFDKKFKQLKNNFIILKEAL